MDNKLVAYDKTSLVGTDGRTYAQPVVSQLPQVADRGLLPTLAPLQTATQDVSSVGAVALLPGLGGSPSLANAITFTMDNSAGGAAVVYKMFDGYGLLSAVAGITATGATYINTARTNAFNAQSIQNPYTFNGFNIQAAVSAASIAQNLNFYYLDATGTYTVQPMNLGTAQRNTSYNNQLQTFQCAFTGAANVAVTFSVPAGETITLTWFVAGSSNRLF